VSLRPDPHPGIAVAILPLEGRIPPFTPLIQQAHPHEKSSLLRFPAFSGVSNASNALIDFAAPAGNATGLIGGSYWNHVSVASPVNLVDSTNAAFATLVAMSVTKLPPTDGGDRLHIALHDTATTAAAMAAGSAPLAQGTRVRTDQETWNNIVSPATGNGPHTINNAALVYSNGNPSNARSRMASRSSPTWRTTRCTPPSRPIRASPPTTPASAAPNSPTPRSSKAWTSRSATSSPKRRDH
jgi:hypothetical protein